MIRRAVTLALIAVSFAGGAPEAAAAPCSSKARTTGDYFTVRIKCVRAAGEGTTTVRDARELGTPTTQARYATGTNGQTVYTRWVKTRAGWASAPKVLCLTGPPKNCDP